jgi:hypothetical protein
MKEKLLILAVLIGVVLIIYTFNELNKLTSISKSKKNLITYVTIFLPVVGVFWVLYLRSERV